MLAYVSKSGSAFAHNDSIDYDYNQKSELTNAVAAIDSDYRYAYDFDEIGNRETSFERGTNSLYFANNLNQYTAVDDFTPQFDDDGNQTLIKTATGIWSVTYNGENRPIFWAQGTNTIAMSYDRMGRRVTKNNQRFVYNGYLQIADSNGNAYIWDPTEPIAARPLVWNRDTSSAYYTHDGNKNVSEVVVGECDVSAHYVYTPFGVVSSQYGASAASNPWRFSSEIAEDDTATVYYNYRHYEPVAGRWLSRDKAEEHGGLMIYGFCGNYNWSFDVRGEVAPIVIFSAKVVASAVTFVGAYLLSKYYVEKTSRGGVIEIKTTTGTRILNGVTSAEFVETIESMKNCSVERVEFRGHGHWGEISPFTNKDDAQITIRGPSNDLKVKVDVDDETVDLAELLRCKMTDKGEVWFKGCFTGLDVDALKDYLGDNISKELSKEMPNVKVYGYPLPAFDIRALLQPFGFIINPKSFKTNMYIDGVKQ